MIVLKPPSGMGHLLWYTTNQLIYIYIYIYVHRQKKRMPNYFVCNVGQIYKNSLEDRSAVAVGEGGRPSSVMATEEQMNKTNTNTR